MEIKQVMIFVDDINTAKQFYIHTLGLKIEKDLSKEHKMLRIKNKGCLFTIHGGFPRQLHSCNRKISITFSVADIKKEVARLQEKKVVLIDKIVETPIHWFQAFLDPSGNMLEIGQYK
jgi:predicted enzyme related to lactoylglutathione lyase